MKAKRFAAILICAALMLSLAGCAADAERGIKKPMGIFGKLRPRPTAQIVQADPYKLFTPLVGYWNAEEGVYFCLDMADSKTPYLEEGMWGTEFSRSGYVSGLELTGAKRHAGKVDLDGEAVEFTLDWSDIANDVIKVTLGGQEHVCSRAGQTPDEASAAYYQSLGQASRPTDLISLWAALEGCYESADDRFVCFFFEDGEPRFLSGTWGTPVPYGRPYGIPGEITVFEGYYTLGLTYPPLEDAADEQDLRSLYYSTMIGVSDPTYGEVSVEAPDDQLRTYSRMAESYEEGYEVYLQRQQ